MASSAGVFFAGVGTTFAILAAGFGGGLMLAKSALHDPPVQMRAASAEPPAPARVILATTAQPAVPAPEPPSAAPKSQPLPPAPEERSATAAQKQAAKAEARKAERELRAERRRIAERKARKLAAERARRMEARQPQPAPGILAFGGEQPHSGSFFGN